MLELQFSSHEKELLKKLEAELNLAIKYAHEQYEKARAEYYALDLSKSFFTEHEQKIIEEYKHTQWGEVRALEDYNEKVKPIRDNAINRTLKHFSEQPHTIADAIQEDLKKRIVMFFSQKQNQLSENEFKSDLITKTYRPFLEFLNNTMPDLYHQTMAFIYDAFTNKDKILQKARKQKRKSTENAVVKGVEEYLSPVDKSSSLIFDRRKNSAFYDTKAFISVGKKGDKVVETLVCIRPENLDNVSISNYSRLTPYDRAVHDALISIYASGNSHATIPLIYRTMRGNNPNRDKPEAKCRKEIEAAIEKLMHSILTIDATNEAKAFGFQDFTFKGQLIPMQYVTAKINGQDVDCVKFLAEPPLLAYAGRKNQINRCDIKMLDVPLNNSEENTTIKTYLLERLLSAMNTKSKMGNVIRYDTLYEYLGLEAPSAKTLETKQRRVRDKVHTILEAWKKAGIISDFTEHKEGNVIVKVELYLLNLPKLRT